MIVEVKNFFPVLAAIASAENAALRIFAVRMAESSDEHDIGIRGMDDDSADVTRVFQSNVIPCFAGIVRAIDAIAERDVTANAGFAGANIDDVGIGIGDGNGPNGGGALFLEEGIPGNATIHRFPNAACDSAKIISVGLAGHARYG